MANASQKKIAAQNEKSVKNLHLGMLIASALSIVLRILLRRSPGKGTILLLLGTAAPEVMLYRNLVKLGTVRRDASGNLLSAGEDLNQGGITEWSFDVIYVTWLCQVGSSAFGEFVWFIYLIIPFYAVFKLWSKFGPSGSAPAADELAEPLSKRQAKLKARSEKGDSRVKSMPAKR